MRIKDHKFFVYVIGDLEYREISKKLRTTRFCGILNPDLSPMPTIPATSTTTQIKKSPVTVRAEYHLSVSNAYSPLWGREFGASDDDTDLVNVIFEVIEGIRDAYRPMAGSREASNTLVTKVILGTFGSLLAVDRYFVSGFKSSGRNCSGLNIRFVTALLEFASENRRELRRQQLKIEEAAGIKYPIMKLVDMYFWQIGAGTQKRNVERELALVT